MNNQDLIRRKIRRNRLLLRLKTIAGVFFSLLIIASFISLCFATKRSLDNSKVYRLVILKNEYLMIEQGRMLPWLEFHQIMLDIPGFHTGELHLAEIAGSPDIDPLPENQTFQSETELRNYIASIYQSAGLAIDRQSLSGASRAVTILETAKTLNPDLAPDSLAIALKDLADRFESAKGKRNYMEAWKYLSRSKELLPGEEIDKHQKNLSLKIERKWFHHINEHFLDGNIRAANVIVTELENCGFNHSRLKKFRTRLDALMTPGNAS